MIETRTLALVVGSLSLAFGIWAATEAPSEVGLAAGVLGFVAGLIVLVPRGTRQAADQADHATAAHAPGTTRVAAEGEIPGNVYAAAEPDGTDETTGSTAGHFDLDSAPGSHDAHRAPVDVTPANIEPPAADAVPAGQPGAEAATEPAGGASATTSLTDPVTGLFSEDYLVVALEGRLASARRHLRPVALALLQISQGLPDTGGRPADPGLVAEAISNTVRDSDIACRLSDGTFGVILEDTPENGAVWTVERIRRNLVSTSGHHTLWAGVACYPAHAFDAGELMTQVHEALSAAKEWNQDRIEVAIAE